MSTTKRQRGTASRRTDKRRAEDSAPLLDHSNTSIAIPIGHPAIDPGGSSVPGRRRDSPVQWTRVSSSPVASPRKKSGLPAVAADGDHRHGIAADELPRRVDQTEMTVGE
ncbi:hypothetical protein MRX96_041743 [Rhipicephalus microplus]